MNLCNVAFDLDGTLIESAPLILVFILKASMTC